MSDQAIQIYKESDFGKHIEGFREYAGELTLEVNAHFIPEVIKALKEGFGFNFLSDITATDHFEDHNRFEVSYNLVNLNDNKRIRVSTRCDEEKPEVPSITHIFTSAGWNEREAFDMVGVKFPGNHDLRRMFMPEDFQYFPLRKEFPLIGIPGSIQMPEVTPPKEYK